MSFICIAVVLCLVPDLSSAEFTVVPMTLNVTAGEPAVFTCRHSSTNFIAWTVNGVSAQSTNVTMSGVSVAGDTLTILALPENNGTVVECVAFFLDGSPPASTPPVVLIVQGNCNSTVAIAFIEEPQSQNVAIGETAQFRCRHPTADYIGWTLNGSSTINNTNNVSTKTVSLPGHDHGGRPRYILLIGAIPTYQGTIVICVARFINNCDSQDSAPAVLLIQGPLEAVSNIIRGLISDRTFSWNPPRSLDLTNVEPDVAYYVTIHNITCGKNDLLVEDHTVLDTYFMSSTIIPDSVYRIKVVPRSNVENAVNGTPLILEEEFIDYQVSQIHFIINPGANNLTATIEFTPNMTVPGHRIIPGKYKVIMTTNDGQGTYTVEPSISGTPSTVGLNLTFFLPTRRLWKYVLLAHNCRQHSLGSGTISTHDLQISTTTPQPGQIEVTGEFIDQSRAKGVLIIVYSFSNKSDSDIRYISPQPKTQLIHALVTNLNYSQYGVSVFIVEENGLPFSRVASIPEEIKFKSLTKEPNQPSHINIKYSLQSTSTGVCITCTFLDSSATDCVAVVHQRISQLSSSGLMNIESSHKLTRSGDTASGCIEGVNMEDYQVGVFEWRQLFPTTETEGPRSCEGCIAGAVLVVVVFILVVVIVALIVVRKWKMTKSPSHIVDVEAGSSPSSDHVVHNHTENEATVQYESILPQGSQVSDEVLGPHQPLLSPSPSTRRGVLPESSLLRDSVTNAGTIQMFFSASNPGDSDPTYAKPQQPGIAHVQPPSNEEPPPPIPPKTEESDVLMDESSSSSPTRSSCDTASTDLASPSELSDNRNLGDSDPMYDQPQPPGSTDMQPRANKEEPPPPVPPKTEESEILVGESSDKPQMPDVKPFPSNKRQVSSSGELGGQTYAQPELPTSSSVTTPPPATEPVVYEDVKGFKNPEGQQYAILGNLSTSKKTCTPDDSDQKKTVYSVIQPHSLGQTTPAVDTDSDKSSATTETHTDPPFTVEHIYPTLLFMASKWQALGEALSLDEDRLDEIFTNNENDEACLHVMLEFYMERSDLKHSWEEIETAMNKVKEAQDMDASTKDSSPPIPPRDITGQMLYHSNSSQHNNDDFKSSFEEKIVQSDDSCRVDKDEGQFTSGRHETTTVNSEKSQVNDDRSCQVTCCCSEESFQPLQGTLQQPLTFTSSVQQDAKDSGLNDPNTHQPVVPDQCHNDHESFQQKCDREEKDEGYSSSTLDSSEDSSYPESECVLPIQETEQGHPLEQLIVQGSLVMVQPESLDHLRCHDKQSIECEQLHNIVSVQIHQH